MLRNIRNLVCSSQLSLVTLGILDLLNFPFFPLLLSSIKETVRTNIGKAKFHRRRLFE